LISARNQSQSTSKLHYGWVIVGIGFLVIFACIGLARYAYTMVLPSMQAGLGLPYDRMGFIGTGNFSGYLLSVVLAPLLIKRFRPRAVITGGLILITLSLFGISVSHGFFIPLAMYFLVGIGTGFANSPTIYHSTGDGMWRGQNGSPMKTVSDIGGTGPNHVFAVAGDTVFFSTGDGAWTPQLVVQDDLVSAVHALDRETVYACTADANFYRSNGAGSWSSPERIASAPSVLGCFSIWGTGPDNLYVGTSNGIYHGTPNDLIP